MIKASIRMYNLELNYGQYTGAFYDALAVQNRQAARAWLRAVILKVPVFTGEARGSLKPLGQFLNVAVPINPVANRKDHSPETGYGQATFSFDREGDGVYQTFSFTQELIHYLINEFYDVNPPIHLTHLPRPWASFEVGKLAYKAYMKSSAFKKALPEVKSFLTRGIILGRSK